VSDSLRLLLVSGTRADFGLWTPILREAQRRDGVGASILATAQHLDPRFGGTIDEVRASGWRIAAEVPCTPIGDGRSDMATALGTALIGMGPAIERDAPDWLLVLGDRGEQLAAALVAAHVGLAVAHLHGGEITLGTVDNTVRDLVSRIAHLHLPATEAATSRLGAMGEDAWRIHTVGAPGLDLLRDEASGDLGALRRQHGLGEGPYLVVIQHPETVGARDSAADLQATLEAVRLSGLRSIGLFPNADAGGRAMLVPLADPPPGMRVVPSLPRGEYATLLAGAAALVGNSSSGMIEAPALRVPAVNVGERQAGRTRGDNVIDAAADADSIVNAIRRAVAPDFVAGLSGRSPYGDGATAPRVLDALQAMPRDGRLLRKHVGWPVE
jgi:GDP/UDP-N,N'-diacetylbacillosamine 2-epimerase (hydrolysing)